MHWLVRPGHYMFEDSGDDEPYANAKDSSDDEAPKAKAEASPKREASADSDEGSSDGEPEVTESARACIKLRPFRYAV